MKRIIIGGILAVLALTVAPSIAIAHHPNITGTTERPCGPDAEWTGTFTATADADRDKEWRSEHRIDSGPWSGESSWQPDETPYGPFPIGPFPADDATVTITVRSDWRPNGPTNQTRTITLERPPTTDCPPPPTTTTEVPPSTTTTVPATTTTSTPSSSTTPSTTTTTVPLTTLAPTTTAPATTSTSSPTTSSVPATTPTTEPPPTTTPPTLTPSTLGPSPTSTVPPVLPETGSGTVLLTFGGLCIAIGAIMARIRRLDSDSHV